MSNPVRCLNSIFLEAVRSARSIPVSSPTATSSPPQRSTGTYLRQLSILILQQLKELRKGYVTCMLIYEDHHQFLPELLFYSVRLGW